MKKRWLIAAAALLLVGIAVCTVSISVLGFDFKALGTETYETKTYPVGEDFENISINVNTDKIHFLPAEDGKCTVVCRETEKITHTVEVQKGTLTIGTVDERRWIDQIGINIGTPEITVYLPKDAYGALTVDTDTGDVDISENFTFKSIQIHGDTADVSCRAKVSGGLEIGLSTGDIDLAAVEAGSMDLKVSTGHVKVESAVCKGDVTIRVSTGKTVLDGLTCANLSTEGSTGDITLKDVVASGAFNIKRSTGDVRFENADAAEIYVKTDTGDVTGTLRSDKVFFTESDTGKQKVPKTITGGRCDITTDTGDIEISVS